MKNIALQNITAAIEKQCHRIVIAMVIEIDIVKSLLNTDAIEIIENACCGQLIHHHLES